jgi:hypothetical protein
MTQPSLKKIEISQIRHDARTQALREAVVWVVQNIDNYQPEALAKNMADDLMPMIAMSVDTELRAPNMLVEPEDQK